MHTYSCRALHCLCTLVHVICFGCGASDAERNAHGSFFLGGTSCFGHRLVSYQAGLPFQQHLIFYNGIFYIGSEALRPGVAYAPAHNTQVVCLVGLCQALADGSVDL